MESDERYKASLYPVHGLTEEEKRMSKDHISVLSRWKWKNHKEPQYIDNNTGFDQNI